MTAMARCVFCGGEVGSRDRTCPRCGGANENYIPGDSCSFLLPQSIREMKEYCEERELPLEQLRFFIGEDYREPRAYGIYKAGENRYIAYKNKADGSRSIRYDGPDEAFAVSEILAKLLESCRKRGILKIEEG